MVQTYKISLLFILIGFVGSCSGIDKNVQELLTMSRSKDAMSCPLLYRIIQTGKICMMEQSSL